MKITTALRSSIAQSIISDISAGSISTPMIEIYEGVMPSAFGGSITDTLLAELALTNGAATESNGTITFDTISSDASANDDGTAGWARILDRDGDEAIYLTVTGSGGGGDIELNTTSISAGSTVSITSGTISVGGQ